MGPCHTGNTTTQIFLSKVLQPHQKSIKHEKQPSAKCMIILELKIMKGNSGK